MALWIIHFSSAIAQELKVERISLSTRAYDEASPVFYKDGLIFCTNRRSNSLAGYSNGENSLYNLFYSTPSSSGWKTPVLFSREITTSFNEGPLTINSLGTEIYFTRNIRISKSLSNITDTANKLGIFSAQWSDDRWTNIKPFTFNDPLFVFATPSITADNMRLFFASDMPGGFGGLDLYYCDRCGTDWCKPLNMGPVINTPGNESYPFADVNGRIYFASDGHSGLGGKDIFYTFEENGEWIRPIHLDSLINTPYDDFGFISDTTGLNGYFTSDRMNSDDIYRFFTVMPEFSECDTFREPSYCFTFYDERYAPNDTLLLNYTWDFGNGITKYGTQAGHCFPGPGNYTVILDIIDQITGDTVAWHVKYDVVLDPPQQLFLNSVNLGLVDREILFDSYGSVIPDVKISDYLWDFGNGFVPGLSSAERKFRQSGKYLIKSGIKGREEGQNYCTSKELRILESVYEFKRTIGDGSELRLLYSGDLSDVQKAAIEEKLGSISGAIHFGPNDLDEASVALLEKISSLLSDKMNLHLEILVFSNDIDSGSAQMQSRELSFFLKKQGINQEDYGVNVVAGKDLMAGNAAKGLKGVVEIILMGK